MKFSKPYPVHFPTVQGSLLSCTLYSLLFFSFAVAENSKIPAEHLEFFENRIRPVLAQECYECHSTRGKKKGGLLLDYRDGLLEGGDSGPAIEPGDASASLLIEALKHEFGLEMPKAGVKLDPPIVADFEKWINLGAPDPRDAPPTAEELETDTNWSAIFKTRQNWWSFQPIQKPEVPGTSGKQIDRFIRAKLEENGLDPAPPADIRTLGRRLHYAITGLPPTPEALDQLEKAAADRDRAVNELIDNLLESPRFGERWARHWMDWVRYAESHGSEGDPKIDNAHFYRDYLIRALNRDIPYDQMLLEHIAGDLLENPRISENGDFNESTIGAAHWRMVFHGFAPTDALDEKVRFTDDQINTFTKAFQSLTVSCARCHDHKFDAISQADYYALFGILGSTRPGRKLIDLPETLKKNQSELSQLKPAIREAIATDWLNALPKVEAQFLDPRNWKKTVSPESIYYPFSVTRWDSKSNLATKLETLVADRASESSRRFDLSKGDDYQSWYQYGNGVTKKPVAGGEFMLAPTGKTVIEKILPAGMYSGLLSTKHAGRLTSPDIPLSGKSKLMLLVHGGGKAINRYVVQNYPRSGTVFKIDRLGEPQKNKPAPGWHWQTYDLNYWEGDEIHIELATAKDTAVLVENVDRSWFGIRDARIVESGTPTPFNPDLEFLKPLTRELAGTPPASPEELATRYTNTIRTAIKNWKAGIDIDDSQALLLDKLVASNLLPNRLEQLPTARKPVETYRKLEAEIKAPTRVPGLDEWTARDQPLYDRGDHKKPLEPVSRRYLEAVDTTPYQTKQSGRLQMAEDLLRDDNPFTRRVIVNRIWTHLFGNGIVGSIDNFGRLGEKPSHPELLDYLASRFDTELDWSIKSLVKEIVSSATWQQSNEVSEKAQTTDPENRLLASFPVRRLDAEAIRDKLITVSGRLNDTMYGPAVDGNTPRRSVYVEVIRNRLDKFLGVFDAPIPFSTTGKRPVTNVPAQSLTMLNDPQMKLFASAFANSFSGPDSERIEAMWTHALGRAPREEETKAATHFLKNLRARNQEIEGEATRYRKQIEKLTAAQRDLLSPIRKKLEAELGPGDAPLDIEALGAVASWDFETGTTDSISSLKGKLTGGAKIVDGDLILDGASSFFSDPLPLDIKEKSLEVLVTLSTLNQRAGGAITLQDIRGGLFDSIVFAERRSNEWLSGSNNFKRTRDFNGKPETEAAMKPTHLVITYDAEGNIRGYRNGVAYGKPYHGGPVARYQKDASQIVLGLRHGTKNGGNKNLKGIIHEARLYNRALDEDSVASLASGQRIISKKSVIEKLTAQEKETYFENESIINELNANLSQLQKEGSSFGEKAVWESFAHSLFNLKEFIYVY
ncbi:MAG: DUF1553 domain-containing protein [Verrucomicrobiales bacterium]|nr:DUF1553 domain-containing protein [Verrucomicrobiales bacterium]